MNGMIIFVGTVVIATVAIVVGRRRRNERR
jgi:LPXTG-motif cell wall-anchored protein